MKYIGFLLLSMVVAACSCQNENSFQENPSVVGCEGKVEVLFSSGVSDTVSVYYRARTCNLKTLQDNVELRGNGFLRSYPRASNIVAREVVSYKVLESRIHY